MPKKASRRAALGMPLIGASAQLPPFYPSTFDGALDAITRAMTAGVIDHAQALRAASVLLNSIKEPSDG